MILVLFFFWFLDYVMPISSLKTNAKLKKSTRAYTRGKSAEIPDKEENKGNQFLTIAPALPVVSGPFILQKSANNSLNKFSSTSSTCQVENGEVGGCNVVNLQQSEESKYVVASRSVSEREKNPDRICLDKRGLTTFPKIVDEPKLRLVSLQHNLISTMETDHFSQLSKLVFLDLYDNQIDKFCSLDPLENLRVLLMGKNRIKKMDGIRGLSKLEVLDLHGNQIMQVSGLEGSTSLKVLNLAGNNIKMIGQHDFIGLCSLKELNLRRNKIKKILGLERTIQLQKLYLSNNDIQKIEDMGSVVQASQIREITLDGNGVSGSADCVSFLISYLPNLQVLSSMQINEQHRRNALAWRASNDGHPSDSAFLHLSAHQLSCVNVHREQVISNAKSNWELLRLQRRGCFSATKALPSETQPKQSGFTLNRCKTNNLASLTCINETGQAKMLQYSSTRSSSTDSLYRAAAAALSKPNNAADVDGLNFKLPPILVPIIDNLTNNKGTRESSCSAKADHQDSCNSSDSDAESAESHESLKSALRNHLVKSSGRATSTDRDTPLIDHFVLKNLSVSQDKLDKQHSNNQLDSQSKPCPNSRPKFDLMSKGSGSLDSNRSVHGGDSSSSSMSSVDRSRSSSGSSKVPAGQVRKVVGYRSNRAATARAKHRSVAVPSASLLAPPPKHTDIGGDYLVEIQGRCLQIYGQGALRCIDKPWDSSKANQINLVEFNYVNFDGIATILSKLKQRFPNVVNFHFTNNNISYLGQINALARTGGVHSIHIQPDGNPIVSKNWKTYATFRLAHWGLRMINGMQITEESVELANKEYSGLADIVMWSLPESELQPVLHRFHLERIQKQSGAQMTAKQFLFNSDPVLRNVIAKEALEWRNDHVSQDNLLRRHDGKIHFLCSIERTIDVIEKLKMLDNEWPSILYELVYNTLVSYSDMSGYMKQRMRQLERN